MFRFALVFKVLHYLVNVIESQKPIRKTAAGRPGF